LAYLVEHPAAADSVIGVRQWWLAGRFAEMSDTDVRRTLDALVAAGKMKRFRVGDGTDVYSAQAVTPTNRE